ncbi:hypothetical protein RM545_11455 [Zunongwangia sp. F260]|uniref:Uncharacterized protein n=1 Tax=Autumnicola lenta TaxID=3075593 RepID=A0ABU3CLW6_9FLAO|nr:hypothetical protein [Zunongwangia sp. F260]MDT0647306.1 hypothetical protein [Zunongwangia sp. F260]
MAEINVEKKKSKWLWIILAAIILGIILLVFLFQDGNVDEENENPDQLEEVTLAPGLLLHSSNVKFLQELHAPFRIKIEALV